MGLDMYLTAKRSCYSTSLGSDNIAEMYNDAKALLEKHGVSQTDKFSPIQITTQIGYWRKANAIHAWFVNNVQDGKDECQEAYVSKQQLVQLRDVCQTVLNTIETVDGTVNVGTLYENGKVTKLTEPGKVITNANMAANILPTKSGFFFGSTDYDEGYIQDLTDTVEIMNRAIEMCDKGWEISYCSSW